MHPSPLLGPIVALVAWSIVMLVWHAVARSPIVRGRLRDDAGEGDSEREGRPNWRTNNYLHLMGQPTIFYAIVFALVLMGFDRPINLYLAWGYVGLRIAHSIARETVRDLRLRDILFLLATVCLACLTVHAGLFLLHHHG
ncbi:MAG TPA: MAPEG family protein [Sphingomicrobium sp.]|jgi:hypothetical protein|nr:MAPEG family protein [Sphingomicrobium sp.]